MKSDANQSLTFPEVCKALNVSRPTLLRLIRDERIKGFKLVRQWRFERGEVERMKGKV